MTSAHTPGNPLPDSATASQPKVRSLRTLLGELRSGGQRLSLEQAIEVLVPLCVAVSEVHQQGYGLHLHPSNVLATSQNVFALSRDRAGNPPRLAEDRACLPPEGSDDELGDRRASVYSIGAIFYELLTGMTAGVGMKRPSDVRDDLPASVEALLAKALVSDPQYRPDDLLALAQAIYQLAPLDSIPVPPRADASHLDQVGDMEVDVSLSMLPPEPTRTAGGLDLAVRDATRPAPTDSATEELAALKARLESDPSPRYVVVHQGMDHGPFNAVELLRQIANHTFSEDDLLHDQATSTEKNIAEWSEFAPFADHARRHRDIREEKAAIDHSVAQESKATKGKAALGFALLGIVLAGAATWFLTQKGTRSDRVAVQTDTVSNIEAEGDLKGAKKGRGKRKSRTLGSKGGVPILAGGMSCGAAQAAYVEEIKMAGSGQADITRGQYASLMNNGAYFSHCGVPSHVGVSICAAVQNGRAVGVTVTTKPNHGSRRCISSAVRKLKFPSHPKLDVVRVGFAAQ